MSAKKPRKETCDDGPFVSCISTGTPSSLDNALAASLALAVS